MPTPTKTTIQSIALQCAYHAERAADLQLDLRDVDACISRGRLAKMVRELVDNAFKFSEAGNLVKVLSTVEEDKFILSVVDHGRGMLPEQITALGAYMQFDRRFYEQPGIGLGLTIVRKLAELHNGELAIASLPDAGTVARVVLKTAT